MFLSCWIYFFFFFNVQIPLKCPFPYQDKKDRKIHVGESLYHSEPWQRHLCRSHHPKPRWRVIGPPSLSTPPALPLSSPSLLSLLIPDFLIQGFGRREGTKREPDVCESPAPASSLLSDILKPGALTEEDPEPDSRGANNSVPRLPREWKPAAREGKEAGHAQ